MNKCKKCQSEIYQEGCCYNCATIEIMLTECKPSLYHRIVSWTGLKTTLDCLAVGGLNGTLVQHLGFGVWHSIVFVMCSTWILVCAMRDR